SVMLLVSPNPGLERAALVVIAGKAVTVYQSGGNFGGGEGGSQFVPVTPCRIFDSRGANGPLAGPFLGGGTTRTVPVLLSNCGIPASATAYSLNVTVVPKTGVLGFLTVWPSGQPQPNVSTLNSLDGSVLANAAIVLAGTSGSINAFATNDT